MKVISTVVLLGIVSWCVFAQTLTFPFVNYDDPTYVTSNLLIQNRLDLFTVSDTFLEVGRAGNWHPLTWISLLVDYQLFDLEPWGYHVTNVLLHTANVLLLFAFLRGATGCLIPSAIVAGFFAMHPAHVESVAWVSERKDVLSTFFWLLTMLAYLAYVRRPSWRRYLGVVFFFALGLLAKPMVVTLPAVLLLLDYWPLGRFSSAPAGPWKPSTPMTAWQLVREKLPLFLLSAGSAAMTVWAQKRDDALRSFGQFSFLDRVGNALIGYGAYLRQLIWPRGLAPFYPLHAWQSTELLFPAAALIVISLLALLWARRQPAFLIGWLWFVGTLVPVIGLVQVGWQAYADRYTYVPFIGLFIALTWLAFNLFPTRSWRIAVSLFSLLLLAVSGTAAYVQTGIWKSSSALWEHTLAVTHDNFVAHVNLAAAYREAGRVEEALQQVQQASVVCPDHPKAHLHMARLWSRHGQPETAVRWLETSVQKYPNEPGFHLLLGQMLRQLGRPAEAARWEDQGQRLQR